MSTWIICPAPGIQHAGAHVTHIPAHLRASEVQTFDAMRAAGIVCPVCQGNGMIKNESE